MARRVRHVYPDHDEYVVIHRGGNNNNGGCGCLLLILMVCSVNYWKEILAGLIVFAFLYLMVKSSR